MRILLDESIPRRLGFALPGHFVRTVQIMGWAGLVIGKLLAAASSEFDVLKETGLHATHDEVAAWMDSWGTEKELPTPACHT